jgi:ribosomal protein L37E
MEVSILTDCSRCGGRAKHVNLRGNKECDGCGYPV